MTGGATRYEILEPAGASPLGSYFKARDRELERLVLLWLLPAALFQDEGERRLCLRRAAAVAALHHPSLLPLHETGETGDGGIFQAFAWAEGETLARRLEAGPLKPAVAVDLTAQIAAGLDLAHGEGIVHGHLDPSSLLITSSGEAKLLDLSAISLGERTRADVGSAWTAAWLAPEQEQGLAASVRSDVWGLGAMLYEMVAGVRPGNGRREPLSALRPEVSADLERIVERALAPAPADRYASAGDLRQALAALARPGSGPGEPARRTVPPPGTEAGGRIGHYRLLEPLGGGGMGVVYRAEDVHLGRTVALKLLPPELARDPVAKARFLQEARAASALEHPNLCTLYDAGETAEGRLWLAMPCYDGETLRRRLERGPLPVDEAVDVARQIALGLAKAHRQGIVHRDVKPANLMLTSDGVVKILDFGLAKLAGQAALTRTGVAVGTPAYMSPEQARGGTVDHRTDLWALGVVLYEMLAGRRPFPGEQGAAVLEGILHRKPETLAQVRPEIPPRLAEVTGRLLAKEKEERYESAEEVAADLRSLFGSGSISAARPPAAWRAPRTFWVAGLLLALAVAGGLAVWLLRTSGASREAARFQRLTDQEGIERFPSLSPAGDFFAYAKEDQGDLDIFLQRVGGTQPINLTSDAPGGDSHPAFSPDGGRIAFWSQREGGGIFLMGATGEYVRRVAAGGFDPAWSPDGREIAYATAGVQDPIARQDFSRIWRVDVATGRRRLVAEEDAVQPSWSPDGGRIAFWGLEKGTSRRRIWTVPAEGGPRVAVTDGTAVDWSPVWSPDGSFLYFVSDRSGSMNLWRVAIDERTGRPLRAPEAVIIPAPWIGYPGFSRDGRRMIYTTRERRSTIEKLAFDPERMAILGAPVQVTRGVRDLAYVSASPDGKWLVFKTADSPENLFLIHPDGSDFRQITDDPAKDRSPVWFPDGRILFSTDRSGKYEAWSVRTDGSGFQQLTAVPREPVLHPISSPDGRRIAFALGYSATAWVDLQAPLERRVLRLLPPLGAERSFFPYCWSGDELVGATETGLVTWSFATGRGSQLLERGTRPICRKGSREILFIDGQGGISGLAGRTGTPRQILARPDSVTFPSFDLSPDGRWLYLLSTAEEGDLWLRDTR